MTETLGIHLDADGISAAVAPSDPSQPPTVLCLGTTQEAAASAVAAGPDGSVLVGDAALDADGPIVTDPLERAVRGRIGALTAVIADLVAQSAVAAESGESPNRLAIVIPDDFDAGARDQVVAAANGAGITDVSLVPYGLAVARGRSDDGGSLASGAALLGSMDAPPPIITAEELGQPIEAPASSPHLPPVADGPASVFDEFAGSGLPPVRDSPQPMAAQPARPRPAAPASTPAAMIDAPPLQAYPQREIPWGAIVAAVAAISVVLMAIVVLSGGGDDDTATGPPSTSQAVTTTQVTNTTEPASTTDISTSTSSSSSTSSTSTSSTSSTSTTTTTTTPVRVAGPGPVTLVETGLQFDTGVVVRFGDSEDDVIVATESVLGPADSDSGRSSTDFCDGTFVRFVRWGSLELVFTGDPAPIGEGEDDDGDPSRAVLEFTQWYADGHRTPTGLVTPEGIGESATIGLLHVTFANAIVIVAAFQDDIVGVFAVTNPGTGAVLNGTTLGLDPDGVVTSLWAGDSCTRVFT